MDCFESPYELLLKAVFLIPIYHYLLGLLLFLSIYLYHFLEIHFFQDFFTGFRGQRVSLTFHADSKLYQEVVSKCKVLHGRYLVTPWLCSPHLQTAFLQFFGRAPVCNYKRQIFRASDGGTIALDWLRGVDGKKQSIKSFDGVQSDDGSPIMVVIPGLTSDSDSAYIKHLVVNIAKRGWNVVVSNHRGLGGVSMTSDCFYNAGWTEDARKIIDYLNTQYPQAPLFVVGTSIGANVLVKYLGEGGVNTAIVGAAAICSPWDLLIGDRFIKRRLVQRFYDRALSIGLKDYAKLHQSALSRLADWEGIAKSRSVRDFDTYATCVLTKLETPDTYYRKSSSASYVGNVMVPLLCISALDDPVCTREAIPWDECRANKNVILATTHHGGHLGYFEGITAKGLWWVRAVDDFFCALNSSPWFHQEKIQNRTVNNSQESCIDQAPYVNVTEDGLVTAFSDEPSGEVGPQKEQLTEDSIEGDTGMVQQETNVATQSAPTPELEVYGLIFPVRRCLSKLSRRSKISMWLLGYIAVITTWPFLSSLFFKKKPRTISSLKK